MSGVVGLDEATLQQLRDSGAQPDPLFEEPRRCSFRPCSKPLQRRDGEKPVHFRLRNCCNASCANRHAKGSTIPTDLPDRGCEECGQILRRRDGESPSRFTRRRFCSRPCGARNGIRNAPRREQTKRVVETKVCARCGQEMVCRGGEPPRKFRDRKFCSTVCRYRAELPGGEPAETKVCVHCGAVFERLPRRLWPGKKWAARRYCSPGCASRSRANRVEPQVVPSRDRQRRKPPTPEPPVVRPSPEALLPDPAVVDMDKRRREALRMLNDEAFPARVAAELGVSLAQVRRWDDGVAS